MTEAARYIPCVGCGAHVPDIEGPTHRYIESAPGCWAIYGEVLAREYSDYRYARLHQLTVDTYAVQHPGKPSPQSIQSVAVHLMSLYLVFEEGRASWETAQVMQRAASQKGRFKWLDPPASRGKLTVLDVHRAETPDEHAQRVEEWARDVWHSWSAHHQTVRAWAAM